MPDAITEIAPVDLSDSRSYVAGVPHEYFAYLRRHDPVHWQDEKAGPGFWAVTKYDDCVSVNRDWERFSSARRGNDAFRDERRRDRPAEPDDGEHGPAAAHPLPAARQQGLHPAHGPGSRGQHPLLHGPDHRRRVPSRTCRFRDRHLGRAPAAGHRRAPGRARRGPTPNVRLVEPDGGQRGPRVRDHRRERTRSGHGSLRVRQPALRREADRPPRRPHERAHPGGARRREVERDGARAVLPAADGGGERDNPQPDVGGDVRLLPVSGPVGPAPGRPVAAPPGGRRDAPLRDPGDEFPAHGDLRPGAAGDQGGRRGQDRLLPRVGQPRRGGLRARRGELQRDA